MNEREFSSAIKQFKNDPGKDAGLRLGAIFARLPLSLQPKLWWEARHAGVWFFMATDEETCTQGCSEFQGIWMVPYPELV